jgi:hypothetical protein
VRPFKATLKKRKPRAAGAMRANDPGFGWVRSPVMPLPLSGYPWPLRLDGDYARNRGGVNS